MPDPGVMPMPADVMLPDMPPDMPADMPEDMADIMLGFGDWPLKP